MRGRALALLACLAALGCAGGSPEPGPVGRWVVVGHEAPGVAALSGGEARAWVGREARFGPELASFGDHRCESPRYRTREVRTDSLLGIGFRVPPAALGLAAGGRVRITEVSCGGGAWTAPGGLLVWTGADRAYAPWDGVFFVLERR